MLYFRARSWSRQLENLSTRWVSVFSVSLFGSVFLQLIVGIIPLDNGDMGNPDATQKVRSPFVWSAPQRSEVVCRCYPVVGKGGPFTDESTVFAFLMLDSGFPFVWSAPQRSEVVCRCCPVVGKGGPFTDESTVFAFLMLDSGFPPSPISSCHCRSISSFPRVIVQVQYCIMAPYINSPTFKS